MEVEIIKIIIDTNMNRTCALDVEIVENEIEIFSVVVSYDSDEEKIKAEIPTNWNPVTMREFPTFSFMCPRKDFEFKQKILEQAKKIPWLMEFLKHGHSSRSQKMLEMQTGKN